jgi:NADPH:quinone reductase
MKALLSQSPGPAETLVLGALPDPKPQPGTVVVRIKACGVNYPDVLVIEDRYQFKPERPFAPGGEFAGTIESLGEGVRGLAPGDRVMGFVISGCMAELVCVEASRLFRMPEGMPFDEAAAFLMTYVTSYYALVDRGNVVASESLLVLGAGGGVGIAAVEIGKALGARVIAAASSEEKVAMARASGADEGVIYPRGPLDAAQQKALRDLFKEAGGSSGVDVVYDAVGGDYAEPALRSMAWNGRFLIIGFPAGIARIPLNLVLLKGCSVVGVFMGEGIHRDPARYRQIVAKLFEMYAAGQVKPRISARFPLARGGEAIRRVADRAALGKLVVTID